MAIKRFAYRDLASGWYLTAGAGPVGDGLPEAVDFGPVNLLVGPSGAGKSRVLGALSSVALAASEEAPAWHASWRVELEVQGGCWTWQAEVQSDLGSMADAIEPEEEGSFVFERLVAPTGAVVAERTRANDLTYQGMPSPRLMRSRSLLSLLSTEPMVAPVFAALGRVAAEEGAFDVGAFWHKHLDDRSPELGLAGLRAQAGGWGRKVWTLQERFPLVFQEIVSSYRAIFPSVEAVIVEREPYRPNVDVIHLRIREEGISQPIEFDDLSAGMQRVLKFLFQVALAPEGTVLLIDEVENSLGVNCLDGVVDHLLTSGRDIQLIMTSHHPYVINAVPRSAWQIVTRKGSAVTLRPASAFPRLAGRSNQEAFVQLINTPEFEHGIQ